MCTLVILRYKVVIPDRHLTTSTVKEHSLRPNIYGASRNVAPDRVSVSSNEEHHVENRLYGITSGDHTGVNTSASSSEEDLVSNKLYGTAAGDPIAVGATPTSPSEEHMLTNGLYSIPSGAPMFADGSVTSAGSHHLVDNRLYGVILDAVRDGVDNVTDPNHSGYEPVSIGSAFNVPIEENTARKSGVQGNTAQEVIKESTTAR
jgi:hypothetical protein